MSFKFRHTPNRMEHPRPKDLKRALQTIARDSLAQAAAKVPTPGCIAYKGGANEPEIIVVLDPEFKRIIGEAIGLRTLEAGEEGPEV